MKALAIEKMIYPESGLLSRKSIFGKWVAVALIAGAMSMVLPAAEAHADGPWSEERLSLRIGGFWPSVDTQFRLDGTASPIGSDIDFESMLGLEDRKLLPNAELTLRLGHWSRFEVEYFKLARSGTANLTTNLSIGDQTFAAGVTVRSTLDFEMYRGAYGFSFINNDRTEMGVSVGVHFMRMEMSVQDVGGGLLSESGKLTLPLPNLGVYGSVALGDNFALVGRSQLFYLKIGDDTGRLLHIAGAVEYYPIDHVGLGVGYAYFDLDAKSTSTDFTGEFRFTQHGPTAYVKFWF